MVAYLGGILVGPGVGVVIIGSTPIPPAHQGSAFDHGADAARRQPGKIGEWRALADLIFFPVQLDDLVSRLAVVLLVVKVDPVMPTNHQVGGTRLLPCK